MASFQLLDQQQEEELHRSRLLNVDDKPFKRITKRLLTPGALISSPTQLSTPPPDGSTESDTTSESAAQKDLEQRRIFREEILLDFATFEAAIARLQFVKDSNARERERYAAEKVRIEEAAQAVRDDRSQLRAQLDDAKARLGQRKKYDERTEKILSNRLLRTREEQNVNLLKLEYEIAELEKESQEFADIWAERRIQFNRIVQEGESMRRMIRDETDEVERREGMEGEEEDGEVGSKGGATPKHSSHGEDTPRNRSNSGAHTPAHGEDFDGQKSEGLKPLPTQADNLSRSGSRASSRNQSPADMDRRREQESGEDTTMNDATKLSDGEVSSDIPMAEAADTLVADVEAPQVVVQQPEEVNDTMDIS